MKDRNYTWETENLIGALREHRNSLANELEKSEVENNTLLAKVVELEIQVGQLKMEAEERDRLLEDYANEFLSNPILGGGKVGEPQ